MKPLGIVLLFLNLLAAAGVAYLAAKAWGPRHDQNIALAKHELVVSGMPTDRGEGKPYDASKPEETVKLYNRELRVQVINDHFKGSSRGGQFNTMSAAPPLSVVAEVEDMKKQIDTKLGEANGSAAKVQFLVGTTPNSTRLVPGYLTLLADDFEERATFREWLAEALQPKFPDVYSADDLLAFARSALDAKFALATDKPNIPAADEYEKNKREARAARDAAFNEYQRSAKAAGQDAKQKVYLEAQKAFWKALSAKSAPLSDADRRRRSAGLLAVLDPSAGGQKRTAQLVGLSDYTAAVLERTQRLSVMPLRSEQQGDSELTSFALVYGQKLKTSQDLDFMLQRQLDITKTFAAQEKASADQVTTRTKHRDDAQGRTDDLDKRVKVAAAAQGKLEKEIFALQLLVGARFDELFELEDKVFQAEKLKAK